MRSHLEAYLAKGRGSGLLQDPRAAAIVEQVLREHDSKDYALLAWVVMPNHVHVVIRRSMESTLPDIVRRWRGKSAYFINGALKRTGPLWFRDYYDRDIDIEDEDGLGRAVRYVELNPVKARLCEHPTEWPFSSARESGRWGRQPAPGG